MAWCGSLNGTFLTPFTGASSARETLAPEMPHLESHTRPSKGSASQIFFRNQGRHAPNCMASGKVDLLVDALTVGVTLSSAPEEFQIRRGFLFAWSTGARREIRMRLPNTNSATSTGRITLNPRCARSNSSCWKKAAASGFRVDACGPVEMAERIVVKVQAGPTSAGQPRSAYSLISGNAR